LSKEAAMAKNTVGLSGTEKVERLSTTLAAGHRFRLLSILVVVLLCLAQSH
jgi:hypothetical protein